MNEFLITNVTDACVEALDRMKQILDVDANVEAAQIVDALALLTELRSTVADLISLHNTALVNMVGDRGEIEGTEVRAVIKSRQALQAQRNRAAWSTQPGAEGGAA